MGIFQHLFDLAFYRQSTFVLASFQPNSRNSSPTASRRANSRPLARIFCQEPGFQTNATRKVMEMQSARTNQGSPRARTEQGSLKCSRSKRLWNPRNKIQSKVLLQSTALLKHARAEAVQESRNHRGTENKKGPLRSGPLRIHGAVDRTRTGDLLITSELLYQLSHNGAWRV